MQRVNDIAAVATLSPEAAHAMEDLLYTDVLVAIANGDCDPPSRMAAEALKAQRLSFPRYGE